VSVLLPTCSCGRYLRSAYADPFRPTDACLRRHLHHRAPHAFHSRTFTVVWTGASHLTPPPYTAGRACCFTRLRYPHALPRFAHPLPLPRRCRCYHSPAQHAPQRYVRLARVEGLTHLYDGDSTVAGALFYAGAQLNLIARPHTPRHADTYSPDLVRGIRLRIGMAFLPPRCYLRMLRPYSSTGMCHSSMNTVTVQTLSVPCSVHLSPSSSIPLSFKIS